MFDPRLTEEYCGLAGMPWSDQDASGELAAMAIGAALWGFYNQIGEFGSNVTKPNFIGCQYNYRHLQWLPESPVFDKARASGLYVRDWQDVICVNMLGRRFYDETGGQYIANNHNSIEDYIQGDWRNVQRSKYAPNNWLNAALAGIDDGHNGGGPIWAIFDSDAVAREGWQPQPPARTSVCRCRRPISKRPWCGTILLSRAGSMQISTSRPHGTGSRNHPSMRLG